MKVLSVHWGKCSGCSIIVDNEIKFAVSEERFSRIKSDESYPKRSIEEANEILREMLRQAHADSMHSGSLSRLKSIVGLQRTSIGMLLDSLLEQFSEYASAKEYKKAQTIIKLDLKNGSQDLWDDYQAGGDYPPEFEKLTNYMMETLIG